MTKEQVDIVAARYSQEPVTSYKRLGNGHIHQTWKVDFDTSAIVLQRLNQQIFTDPWILDHNIRTVSQHLERQQHYPMKVLKLLPTQSGATLFLHEDHYFRAFHFLENSKSLDLIDKKDTARSIAAAFGTFNASLLDLNPAQLQVTIPNFHNGTLRHLTLVESARHDRFDRLKHCSALAERINALHGITEQIDGLKKSGALPNRIAHYDTKVNNILLDQKTDVPVMVIDLDTTMPGTWLSDYGDMIRTATPTRDENETDLTLVHFRLDLFEAITEGYLSTTAKHLNDTEKQHLLDGGKYLILMQSERFLADYLNGDSYYGCKYERQNLDRALNQYQLLQSIIDQETEALKIIKQLL